MIPFTAMATSLFFLFVFFSFSFHGFFVHAEDPELRFTWHVSYAPRSPFGVEKKVIAINDQFPGPLLNVTTNNVIHINVFNNLDEPFLFTWNGVQMRRNSWNDGVQGTNCPIPPGKNWTYLLQVKDQIGSFFYFPSLGFQMAAGGYGPIRINNRAVIPIPFSFPHDDYDILIADWFNMDYKNIRDSLDQGSLLSLPDGILINGLAPGKANFTFKSGATYRLRISNVGIKTTLNLKIQGHKMKLVETEGSYSVKQYFDSLDIHVGQSYSVLVTADQSPTNSYYMIASSRFLDFDFYGIAIINYDGFHNKDPSDLIPPEPSPYDYNFSMEQARSIRWDLKVGAARPNPQGSYHYGKINITRTIVLQSDKVVIRNETRCTVNGVSFQYPDTPLKLADYFKIPNVFTVGQVSDVPPNRRQPTLGTPVIDAHYKKFIEIIFQNDEPSINTWHLDGYNFFVVGMEVGTWDASLRSTYNMVDAIYRSTVQVYPKSWTAILLALDNMGIWNIRSQDLERRNLGQEVYIRVKGDDPNSVQDPRDEMPFSPSLLRCGRAPSS